MMTLRIEEADSTNSWVKEHESGLQPTFLLFADRQTAGRGQRGNSWESEPYMNLTASICLRPEGILPSEQFLISEAVSMAVVDLLAELGVETKVKWPNDIYAGDMKICGILIENDLMGRNISQSIAGIGININQEEFHSPAPNPVSLYQITGKQYDIFEVLKNIMLRIQSYYCQLKKNDTLSIVAHYEKSLFRKEGMHRYKDTNGEFLARIVCVEPEGRLILEDEMQAKRRYMFKEVEYLLK